jgi:uncharacterized protein YdcH (DUF465 family)
MSLKANHKELKKEVNEANTVRKTNRGPKSWAELRTLKKLKLKAKDKLNATKQKLFA